MALARFIQSLEDSRTFEGPITGIPYAEFLGLRLRRTGDELITWMPFQPMLIGSPSPPRLHGGTTGALLEIAGIIHLAWDGLRNDRPLARLPKPVNLTTEFMRAGMPSDVFARADITKLGRRIANVRAIAWQDDPSKLIAQANIHFLMPGSSATKGPDSKH